MATKRIKTTGLKFTTLLAVALMNGTATLPASANDLDEALELRRNGQLQEAANQLEDILNDAPDSIRVKVELAATYSHLKQYQKANVLFDQLLNQKDLPEHVRKNILAFKQKFHPSEKTNTSEQDKFPRQHFLFASVKASLGNDTNVNGPLDIDAVDDPEIAQATVTESAFLTTRLSGTYRYRFLDRIQLPSGSAIASLKTGARYYDKSYENSAAEHRNLNYLSFYVSPQLSQSADWRIQLPISYRQVTLGDEHLVNYLSIAPAYRQYQSWGNLNWEMELRDRQYVESDNQQKDGLRTGIKLDSDIFILDDNTLLTLGVEGQYQQAKSNDARAYQRLSYYSRFEWELASWLTSYFQITKTDYQYQGIDTGLTEQPETDPDLDTGEVELLYPFRRRDQRTTWQTGLTATILKHIRVGASIYAMHINSNQEIYNYDRVKTEAFASFVF